MEQTPEQKQEQIDKKKCPYCSELIFRTAKKCRFCNEILDTQMRDIEALKKQRSNQNNVQFNNVITTEPQKRGFPHFGHFVMTVLTVGFWFFIWVLHYIFRDRKVYF